MLEICGALPPISLKVHGVVLSYNFHRYIYLMTKQTGSSNKASDLFLAVLDLNLSQDTNYLY
jgi:hypothetical protein